MDTKPLRRVLLMLCVAAGIIPSTPARAGGYITNGLVAYWEMNDGSGSVATDSSGNGINLPLFGSPSWGSNDVIFNGYTQYGDVNNTAFNNLDQQPLTVCAWIYKDGASQKGIVNKFSTGGWSFQVNPFNRLDFFVDVNTPDLSDQGPATIPLGQWTFVAVTWAYPNTGLNAVSYYINGEANSTQGTGGAYQNSSEGADLQVGNIFTGSTYAFDGSMHDVAIYNRVLSAAEIETNFVNSESSANVSVSTNVPPPDLLYYEMTNYPASNSVVTFADASTAGDDTGFLYVYGGLRWESNPANIPNTAAHFNGDNTILYTTNVGVFNFTTNLFTINLWVEPLTADGFLMQAGIEASNGWYLQVGGAYQIYFGTETNGQDIGVLSNPGAAQVNNWNMVTIVRNSLTNAIIYIDGVEAASGPIISPAPSTNALIMGVSSANTHYLDGDIWLPQIWGEALPGTAIANLYINQLKGYPWPAAGAVQTNAPTSPPAQQQPTGYVTNGLAAYWRLNDGSGTTAADSSGNGNNLPLFGSPSWGSNYVTFNGSTQYGDASGSAFSSLDQQAKTICAWITKDSGSQKGIMNKYVSGGWSFQVTENNRLDWFVDSYTPDLTDQGPATIPLNTWTFVAMTWAYPNTASNAISYYINGKLNWSSETGGAYESSSSGADLQVGNVFTGPTYALDGSMHDVAIYNRVLSSGEIQTNYVNTGGTLNP